MIMQVDSMNLYNSVKWLQDLGCRDALTEEAVTAQNWILVHFYMYGLDIDIMKFPCHN